MVDSGQFQESVTLKLSSNQLQQLQDLPNGLVPLEYLRELTRMAVLLRYVIISVGLIGH